MPSNSPSRSALALILIMACIAAPASAEVLLEARFDDKAVDQPLGSAGAAAGEPVHIDTSITAMVRDSPMPSRCIEIRDNDDYYAGSVIFRLVDGQEVTEGLLVIETDLWLSELDSYRISVRESTASAFQFANIDLSDDGRVWADDETTNFGPLTSYSTGRVIPVRFVFDLDSGTYSSWFDGLPLVTAAAHGITGRGIGRLALSMSNDANLDGAFYADNIVITSSDGACAATSQALCLNNDRFRVSATYRTEAGASGTAHAVELTPDTGYLWFFDSDNVEVVVKLLDGCSFNQHYWVFAAGLTNVEVRLTVEDTLSQTSQTWTNPLGQPFSPLQETRAFSTCR